MSVFMVEASSFESGFGEVEKEGESRESRTRRGLEEGGTSRVSELMRKRHLTLGAPAQPRAQTIAYWLLRTTERDCALTPGSTSLLCIAPLNYSPRMHR